MQLDFQLTTTFAKMHISNRPSRDFTYDKTNKANEVVFIFMNHIPVSFKSEK